MGKLDDLRQLTVGLMDLNYGVNRLEDVSVLCICDSEFWESRLKAHGIKRNNYICK